MLVIWLALFNNESSNVKYNLNCAGGLVEMMLGFLDSI